MKTIFLSIILSLSINALAQTDRNIQALWEVMNVSVGDRNLTPTAKWFLYDEKGNVAAGNGSIQNLQGTYEYDSEKLKLIHQNGLNPDPYEAFNVILFDHGSEMKWERIEDGMNVIVSLKKVTQKPKAPWDLLQGGWIISKSEGIDPETRKVKSLYDIDKERYFFMWDRAYRKFNEAGEQIETGVWHIGGHSNEVWTIANSDNTKTKWQLAFENDTMV